jgi:hypothetical protein
MNQTEHSGPKKGRGAYYGCKRAAEHDSGKRRRQLDTTEALEQDPA